MKTAFAVWNNRIAPVFDVARRVVIVDSKLEGLAAQIPATVPDNLPLQKALQLSHLGADKLVCGAISRALQNVLTARGIRVIPFVAGDVQAIINAWNRQNFDQSTFAMPGCRRHGSRRSTDPKQEEACMINDKPSGSRGPGKLGGQGRSGQGARRTDQFSTEVPGNCVCLKCGHTESHKRGVPCSQKKCSQCGALMTRQ